jgi:hypothetical protein
MPVLIFFDSVSCGIILFRLRLANKRFNLTFFFFNLLEPSHLRRPQIRVSFARVNDVDSAQERYLPLR